MRHTAANSARLLFVAFAVALTGCALIYDFSDYRPAGVGGSAGAGIGGSAAGPDGSSSAGPGGGSSAGPPVIQIGGALDDLILGMDVDPRGDVVVAGSFQGSIDLGDQSYTAMPDQQGLFVAKLDASGKVLWSRVIASKSAVGAFAADLAIDRTNNSIVIAGGFDRWFDFGAGPIACNGLSDVFLAKLSPEGKFLWHQQLGDQYSARVRAVTIGPSGSVAITGDFDHGLIFDDPCPQLNGPVDTDAFVAVFDGMFGSCLWARQLGGVGVQTGQGISMDAAGDVVMSGVFQGIVAIAGMLSLEAKALQGDSVFVKLDMNGIPVTAKSLAPAGFARVTADPAGSFLVAGSAAGSFYANNAGEPYIGGQDMLVAKFSAGGGDVWAHLFGGTGDDSAVVTVAPDGKQILAGAFQNAVTLGPAQLTSAGKSDAFIAVLDAQGLPLAAARFGDAEDQGIRVVRTSSSYPGQIVIGGDVWGQIDFGAQPQKSRGGADIFVARLPLPTP